MVSSSRSANPPARARQEGRVIIDKPVDDAARDGLGVRDFPLQPLRR